MTFEGLSLKQIIFGGESESPTLRLEETAKIKKKL